MDRIRQFWYSLSLKTRDAITRAANTAWQTFVAVFPVASIATGDPQVIWSAVAASAAAAVTAVFRSLKPGSSGETVLVPIPVRPDDLLPPE